MDKPQSKSRNFRNSGLIARRKGRRRLACYHEAGHCLARWYFGHSTYRVAVLTAEQVRAGEWLRDRRDREVTDAEGYVDGYDIGPNPFVTEPDFQNLSYPTEEFRLRILRGRRIDTEVELINLHSGILAEAQYTKRSIAYCTLSGGREDMKHARLLVAREYQNRTEADAALLLADRRCRALVHSEKGWAAITALANALFERGEVDGDEIDALHAAAYDRDRPSRRLWHDSWPPTVQMIRSGNFPPDGTSELPK